MFPVRQEVTARVEFKATLSSLGKTSSGLRTFERLLIKDILVPQHRIWCLSPGRWGRGETDEIFCR